MGNDPVNGVDPSGLFLENPEAAVGLGILTAALAGGAEIANAPGPCDKTYASQGPVPLALGTATGVAGGLIWGKVVAPFLGKVLGALFGRGAASSIIGQTFGKLGTAVEPESEAFNGFSVHGWQRAAQRGLSTDTVADVLSNPIVKLQQGPGKYLLINNDAAAVIDGGRVVTAYPASKFDASIWAVLRAATKR